MNHVSENHSLPSQAENAGATPDTGDHPPEGGLSPFYYSVFIGQDGRHLVVMVEHAPSHLSGYARTEIEECPVDLLERYADGQFGHALNHPLLEEMAVKSRASLLDQARAAVELLRVMEGAA
jgi:hypothetical protein